MLGETIAMIRVGRSGHGAARASQLSYSYEVAQGYPSYNESYRVGKFAQTALAYYSVKNMVGCCLANWVGSK